MHRRENEECTTDYQCASGLKCGSLSGVTSMDLVLQRPPRCHLLREGGADLREGGVVAVCRARHQILLEAHARLLAAPRRLVAGEHAHGE